MIELTEADIRILKFISKNEPVKVETLKKRFSRISSLEYRVSQLATPVYDRSAHLYIAIENTSYIQEATEEFRNEDHSIGIKRLRIYSITEFGKKVLQDYKIKAQKVKIKYWIPIVIDALLSVGAIIISIIALNK